MIHDCLKNYVSNDEPVAMVDFPDYKNVGDFAIWLGQMAYLSSRFKKRPWYISSRRDHAHDRLDKAMPSGPILITGGGDVRGHLARTSGASREHSGALARPLGRAAAAVHSLHVARSTPTGWRGPSHATRISFCSVRDEELKAFAEKHFDCRAHLCPDMAFCIGPIQPLATSQFPVLAMLRADKEKAAHYDFSAYPDLPVEDWISEPRTPVRMAKALGAVKAVASLNPERIRGAKLDAAAHNRFRRGIRQISRGRTIVTDRLHVHICALLMGRPHAVLDNSYGKVQRFMNAFSDGTDLSYKATSFDDAIAWARSRTGQGAAA